MERARGFARYELPGRELEAIDQLGWKYPTPVQEQVISMFMQKFNLIVEAPTGTGKTGAYGIPLISRLDLLKGTTQAIVLVPSRELAIQAAKALRTFYNGPQLKVGAVYGGQTMDESFKTLKSGAQILVVVPARLKDVLGHHPYPHLWKDVRFLIVDEGDKLMEMGFVQDFDYIHKHIRNTAQVGFFSATISQDAENMMRERFRKLKTVRINPKQMMRKISFRFTEVEKGKRERYLSALINSVGINQALVFCGRRQDINYVTGYLRNHGYKAEGFYGNMDQIERQNILQRFKENHIHFLVASDLAARGLDIVHLPAVINLAIPEEFDYYLHRIGRTGRAGNKGTVFNLLSSEMEKIFLSNHHQKLDIPVRELDIELDQAAKPIAKAEDKWTKYLLNKGKREKIRKGDVVGFLVNQAGLDADEIGTITIYETYTTVDMPEKGFQNLQSMPEPWKIKGKTVKLRKYGIEDMESKAKSVGKLKVDRRKRMRDQSGE
ncbi:DEAD/DEAH box helicase [Pontibacter sp. G13]|uniref:DEAD/DEAH box helicase n=1 Tax=Pontibacter sp. G13 TaxID=3074898 RepID=UPI0028895C7A|nr:DEAD/DEAH box helicase [Pontibacter sp. G13]WNJ21383.1 DEAD/DEAH box helicase [Pontibacter sp. G13]